MTYHHHIKNSGLWSNTFYQICTANFGFIRENIKNGGLTIGKVKFLIESSGSAIAYLIDSIHEGTRPKLTQQYKTNTIKVPFIHSGIEKQV